MATLELTRIYLGREQKKALQAMGQWAAHVVAFDRQVQDIDRRLVRIETFAEVGVARKSAAQAAEGRIGASMRRRR